MSILKRSNIIFNYGKLENEYCRLGFDNFAKENCPYNDHHVAKKIKRIIKQCRARGKKNAAFFYQIRNVNKICISYTLSLYSLYRTFK